jgi:hypothetical protein
MCIPPATAPATAVTSGGSSSSSVGFEANFMLMGA